MSTDRDATRIVRSWLRADEHESADRVLESVLDALDTTPQRRATWWPTRRIFQMNNTAKLALSAVAVLAIALLGIRMLSSGSIGIGTDPEPTATPNAIPETEGLPLDAGRYWLGTEFPVEMSFQVPAGWISCSLGPLEQGVCPEDSGVAVGFIIVDNVVEDPCDAASLLDPPVGPSIEDLAAAISSLPGFDSTAAENVTVDGFSAKRLTVTAPDVADCEGLSTWATPDRVAGVAPGEANSLYLIDVDAVRIVISLTYFPESASDAEMEVAEEVVASVRISP